MAYQKLQTSKGLAVIPSATVMIPDPSTKVLSGTTTATTANKLVVSGASFLSDGILTNAIVYNTTDNTAAYVTAVDDNENLSLSVDIMASGEDFVIYNNATDGCILYVGGSGNLVAQMAADKDLPPSTNPEITFQNIPTSAFLPFQVVRVDDTTTASNIVALW